MRDLAVERGVSVVMAVAVIGGILPNAASAQTAVDRVATACNNSDSIAEGCYTACGSFLADFGSLVGNTVATQVCVNLCGVMIAIVSAVWVVLHRRRKDGLVNAKPGRSLLFFSLPATIAIFVGAFGLQRVASVVLIGDELAQDVAELKRVNVFGSGVASDAESGEDTRANERRLSCVDSEARTPYYESLGSQNALLSAAAGGRDAMVDALLEIPSITADDAESSRRLPLMRFFPLGLHQYSVWLGASFPFAWLLALFLESLGLRPKRVRMGS